VAICDLVITCGKLFPHKYHELPEGESAQIVGVWEQFCVGPDTYVGGLLTFMRSCDSLHAKITRSQRAYKHTEGTNSEGLK
jgi:hypothetical protein